MKRKTRPHTEAASIRVTNLTKGYGDVDALRSISLDVHPGDLFGLVGPDGAGKSTLLRILVTVIKPDAGQVTIDGLDVLEDYRAIRQIIGYMPGRFSLYPDLTVKENLEFFASVFGTTIALEYDLIAPIYSQIEPFASRRAGALSGGMKQKLALSCALIHRPRVLILDEPTTGVDAVSRREFWDILAELKEGGITTIVSTPYMDEAARCDRIALMQEGRLLRRPDTHEGVAESLGAPLVRVQAQGGSRPRLLQIIRAIKEVERADVFGTWIHVTGNTAENYGDGPRIRAEKTMIRQLESALLQEGWVDVVVEHAKPSVEDVFMTLISVPQGTEEPQNQ